MWEAVSVTYKIRSYVTELIIQRLYVTICVTFLVFLSEMRTEALKREHVHTEIDSFRIRDKYIIKSERKPHIIFHKYSGNKVVEYLCLWAMSFRLNCRFSVVIDFRNAMEIHCLLVAFFVANRNKM